MYPLIPNLRKSGSNYFEVDIRGPYVLMASSSGMTLPKQEHLLATAQFFNEVTPMPQISNEIFRFEYGYDPETLSYSVRFINPNKESFEALLLVARTQLPLDNENEQLQSVQPILATPVHHSSQDSDLAHLQPPKLKRSKPVYHPAFTRTHVSETSSEGTVTVQDEDEMEQQMMERVKRKLEFKGKGSKKKAKN